MILTLYYHESNNYHRSSAGLCAGSTYKDGKSLMKFLKE